ncbi:hypothetical protein [Sneathiella sp.]|uniref:hypothetical protein n=1 Tax=Sneathiella sp. TaxID=1964365 RepID=UPI0035613B37
MFEKNLNEAARKSRQRLLISLMFVVILILGGAVVFLLTQAALTPSSTSPQVEAEEQDTATPASQGPVDQATEPTSEKVIQSRSSGEVVQAISRYEQELEPTIKSDGFNNWDAALRSDFSARQDKLIAHLANGETDIAFEEANQLIADASAAVLGFEAAFDEAMSDARTAYEADDFTGAEIPVKRALELKPEDSLAFELADRIKKLPEILDIMEKARIARVENNLEQELKLSSQIIQIDPRRTLYQDRINEIEILLTERRFETIVTAGLAASQAEQLKALNNAYEQARLLYPKREETQNLAALLVELKRKLTFRQFVKQGDTAIREDNWKTALDLYQNAVAFYPDNAEVQETVILSQKIVQYSKEIGGFLQDPNRLSNVGVRKAAEQTIEAADLYTSMSPALANDLDQLAKEIVRQNTEIEVLVFSDKLTNVSVRGVGKVGLVDQYKIRLKPGDYIFEGKREGFRTKSVRITISPEDRQVKVTVVSDERI